MRRKREDRTAWLVLIVVMVWQEIQRRLHELNNAHENTRREQENALKVARDDTAHYFTRGEQEQFAEKMADRTERNARSIAVIYGLIVTLFIALAGLYAAGKI